MGVFDEGYDQSLIDAARNPIARPPAGFSESFAATWQATRQEDLSISERQNFLDKVRHRDQLILDKTGGYLTNEAAPDPFGTLDLNDPTLVQPGQLGTTVERARLAYQKRIGELAAQYPEIKTDEDLRVEIKADSKRIREETGKVLENTTFAGKIGSFTGAMAASMTDPLVLATLPIGASASAGILRTALVNAGAAMTSEALIQPFVYRYKQKLDSPYSVGEAVGRVVETGAGAAILSTAIKGAELGWKRWRARVPGVDDVLSEFERTVKNPTVAESDAAYVLGDYADVMRETPFTMGPAADEAHLHATAKAIGDLEAGQPVDVQAFTMGREPRADLVAEGYSPEEVRAIAREEAGGWHPGKQAARVLAQAEKTGLDTAQVPEIAAAVEKLGGTNAEAATEAIRYAQEAQRLGLSVKEHLANLADAEVGATGRSPADRARSILDEIAARDRGPDVETSFTRPIMDGGEKVAPDLMTAAEMQARDILAKEDIQIPTGEVIEREGAIHPVTRSARELIHESEQDLKAGDILKKCLGGGGE